MDLPPTPYRRRTPSKKWVATQTRVPYCPTAAILASPYPTPYLLSFQILAHSFALFLRPRKMQLLSSDSALFAKNSRAWGSREGLLGGRIRVGAGRVGFTAEG